MGRATGRKKRKSMCLPLTLPTCDYRCFSRRLFLFDPSAILAAASIRMISGLLLERRHAVELGGSVELSNDFSDVGKLYCF